MFTYQKSDFELFHDFTGVVASASQRSDTHVSAPGSVMFGVTPAINSSITLANEIWLKKPDGTQQLFHTDGPSFAAPGHRIKVISIRNKKTNMTDTFYLENLTTNKINYRYAKAVVEAFSPAVGRDFIFGCIKAGLFGGALILLAVYLQPFWDTLADSTVEKIMPILLAPVVLYPLYQLVSYIITTTRNENKLKAGLKQECERLGLPYYI